MLCSILLATILSSAPTDAPRDSWLGIDKAEHATATFVTSGVVYLMVANDFGVKKPVHRAAIAFGFAVGLGAAKELVWDGAFHNGDPSWKDFTWDVIGAAVGTGICYLVDKELQ